MQSEGSVCGNRAYNQRTQMCCAGRLHRKVVGKYFCCGRNVYNALHHICCAGRVLRKFGDKSTCCAFDPTSHICCGGRVTRKSSENSACCGKKHFNPKRYVCCAGHVIRRIGDKNACCGSSRYNPERFNCCSGRVLSKFGGRTACCGANSYNPSFFVCCGGRVLHKFGHKNVCCGNIIYNPKQHICYHERLLRKPRMSRWKTLMPWSTRTLSGHKSIKVFTDRDGSSFTKLTRLRQNKRPGRAVCENASVQPPRFRRGSSDFAWEHRIPARAGEKKPILKFYQLYRSFIKFNNWSKLSFVLGIIS